MQKGYYRWLLLSVVACAVILLSYYNIGKYSEPPIIESKTRYEYQNVDSPIQPIPQLLESNTEWVQLGKALFNSKLLSRDNNISCSSCHVLGFGGDDGLPVSLGTDNQLGDRNSPTVLNAVFNFRQSWDGRASDLTEQISGPIHNPKEMATNWLQVIRKLRNVPEFSQAFNALTDDGITERNIISAITQFEETLITPDAPIDKFLLGDKSALTSQQQRGLEKFINFGCSSCHQGLNIGGNLYQKLGRVSQVPAELLNDLGRYTITNNEADKHVFKVPSLRNVAQTAPYFHTGSVASLEEAVNIMAKSQLGRNLSSEDVADLIALLESFSGTLSDSFSGTQLNEVK